MLFEHHDKVRQRHSAYFLYAACGAVVAATLATQFLPQFGVPERPGQISPTLVRGLVVVFFAFYALVAVPIRTYHRDIALENGSINLPFMLSPIRFRGEGHLLIGQIQACAVEIGPTVAVQTLVIGMEGGAKMRFNAVELRDAYRRADGATIVDWLVRGGRGPTG